MREKIGDAAMCEQFAEECMEMITEEISGDIESQNEEFTDVVTCGREFELDENILKSEYREFWGEKPSESLIWEGTVFVEDLSRLAKALLKKARILRGENPTPRTLNDVEPEIKRYYARVLRGGYERDYKVNEKEIAEKQERFKERWEKRQE